MIKNNDNKRYQIARSFKIKLRFLYKQLEYIFLIIQIIIKYQRFLYNIQDCNQNPDFYS